MGRLIVATGLRVEAAIFRRDDVVMVCGAANPEVLRRKLDEALAAGPGPILSFGIAGGLAPGLAVGTLVLASAVRHGEERWEADAAWLSRLMRHLPGARAGEIAGVDAPAATLAAKGALLGDAVDMESHVVARAAARRGLPFAVVRAVADDARHVLPPAAMAPLLANGSPDLGAVLASLARHPGQLGDLITLARAANKALAALRAARRQIGPGLAYCAGA